MSVRARVRTYLGVLCRGRHDFDGSGRSERWLVSKACVECKRLRDRCGPLQKKTRRAWELRERMARPFKANSRHLLYRSRALGIPYDLNPRFLEALWAAQEGRCFWLNVPMLLTGSNVMRPYKATLDRLVPNLGYVRTNVVWACGFANRGRSDTPCAEFIDFLEDVAIDSGSRKAKEARIKELLLSVDVAMGAPTGG